LPAGSDPVEVAIREHQRGVERERYIAQHKSICESLAIAPRLEAEQRLRAYCCRASQTMIPGVSLNAYALTATPNPIRALNSRVCVWPACRKIIRS
jgi:hypothetical protein